MVSNNELQRLSERAVQYISEHALATEEAVKHALVLPFIQSLGYDIFDPREVIPEYTADYGMKRGEKVDYALCHQGGLSIIVECKELNNSLAQAEAGQLSRYFASTTARVGILTNGVRYLFFSDLDDPNVMDAAPFLEIDITAMAARDIVHLEHFSKRQYDPSETVAAAANMKFINGITGYLKGAFAAPDEQFVRLMVKTVYSGHLSPKRIESFTPLVKAACQSFLQDRISSTLQRASEIAQTRAAAPDDDAGPAEGSALPAAQRDDIVTTADEIAAADLVASILADANVVTADRVGIRDGRHYCNVILDNDRHKPICRFYFDRAEKVIALFDGSRTPRPDGRTGALAEQRRKLADLSDIANYAPAIIARAQQLRDAN